MDSPEKTLDRGHGGLFSRGISTNAQFDITWIPMTAVYVHFNAEPEPDMMDTDPLFDSHLKVLLQF